MQSGRLHNPVLLTLAGLLTLALFALPFLNYAANRLVAGQPLSLVTLLHDVRWLLLLPVPLLWMLCLSRPQRVWLICIAFCSGLLLAGLLWLAGHHASQQAGEGSPLARTAFGSGLWCTIALCLLITAEVARSLVHSPLLRLAINSGMWVLPLGLLFSGAFDQLSLLKEYANRQQVFDQALSRHLLLLTATVIPALIIGLPLGIWLARRQRWQPTVFGVLNIIQTVPSVALFGLLIAPLAALAALFPLLGRVGISGIGLAPALIALVLYALLPLVRSIVAGLQQVPEEVRETALAVGMGRWQQFCHVDVPLALPVWLAGLRVVTVQTLGMAVIAALIGAGGFGAIIFQGLMSSALDLVLLGVIPVIALAVIVDALFRLLIRFLEVRRG